MSPQPSADLHHPKITHEQGEKESASRSWELVARTHEAQTHWVHLEIVGFTWGKCPTWSWIHDSIEFGRRSRSEIFFVFVLLDDFFEGELGLLHVDFILELVILVYIELFVEVHGPVPLEVDDIVVDIDIQRPSEQVLVVILLEHVELDLRPRILLENNV